MNPEQLLRVLDTPEFKALLAATVDRIKDSWADAVSEREREDWHALIRAVKSLELELGFTATKVSLEQYTDRERAKLLKEAENRRLSEEMIVKRVG